MSGAAHSAPRACASRLGAQRRCCTASTWPCPAAAGPPSSDPTAPARRPCCGRWRSCCRIAAGCHCWAATRRTGATASGRSTSPGWARTKPGADDLLAHDVVMLGRLPHQAWLGAPSARRPARRWSAPCGRRSPGTGAIARWAALRRRAPARAAGARAGGGRAAAADGRAAGQPRSAAPGRLAAHRARARGGGRHGGERAARAHHGAAGRRDGGDGRAAAWCTRAPAATRPRIARWKKCSTAASRCTRWPANGSRCRSNRIRKQMQIETPPPPSPTTSPKASAAAW